MSLFWRKITFFASWGLVWKQGNDLRESMLKEKRVHFESLSFCHIRIWFILLLKSCISMAILLSKIWILCVWMSIGHSKQHSSTLSRTVSFHISFTAHCCDSKTVHNLQLVFNPKEVFQVFYFFVFCFSPGRMDFWSLIF